MPAIGQLRLEPMRLDDIEPIMTIETSAYPFPWTRGNFLDSLHHGYSAWILRERGALPAGYFLCMLAVDETHLLNITVRRDLQGQGLGRLMLDRVAAMSRERGMRSILLEVRPSNRRALSVYENYGFQRIGVRRNYYPAADNTREDAIVMRFAL